MTNSVRIDGFDCDVGSLSYECQTLLQHLNFVQLELRELKNREVLLSKAKEAYVADLKAEIIRGRTGMDLNALFTDG
mgnify:CR=1 FL=1